MNQNPFADPLPQPAVGAATAVVLVGIGAFPFDRGWNEAASTERAQTLHADQIVVGRSMKARHNLAGSLGCRLIGKRGAPVVVVVP